MDWIKKILAYLTGNTGLNDHFTTNICRSFLKVIHDQKKNTKIPAYYLDEKILA